MRGSSSSLWPSQQREREEELPVYEFDAGEEAVETAARKLVALYHPSRLQADFDAGDEAVEAAARKLVARYHPSRLLADGARGGGDDDGITKYSFLQTFQSGQQMKQSEVTGVFCIDVPDSNDMKESFAAGSPEMNQVSHERTTVDVAMATSTSYSDHNNACLDEFEATRITRFGSWRHFELQSHGVVADSEEESLSSSPESLSTTNCDVPGYVEQKMQYGYNGFDEMIVEDGPVILNPEFVMCNAALHMEPQLTFSPDCFKIEYSDLNAYGDVAKMAIKWEISDIICIYCKWTQSVTSAMLRLHVRSTMEAENLGLVRLQFSLNDAHWPKKQQTIWNLASRYQEIWNSIPLDDFTSEDWCVEPSLFFPKRYFSETKDFEDVIYPKGDPDAVSINKRDVDLLLPETFVNDTIIDFYIKYLSSRIQPTEKHRYHFFNSFFFRKLADLDKDQGQAPDGRAAFLRVRKWTRKVNLFEKDFVFIPVNFNLHWSLIVICHPGEVVTLEDDDIRKSPKVPCILHMDSLKGSHCGLKDIIQSYLWEEWKERNPESALDNSEKFLNLRFVSLELPQQDNSFDCGLFLLHYVELFLVDAPSSFNPLTIDEFSSFLSDDWFPPAEASLKRALIRKLIYELVTESSQNSLRATSFDEDHDENYHRSDEIEREPGIEFLAQSCSAGVSNSLSVLDGGLEMRQPSTSICLDNSVEKAVVTSGCILEAGKVSMISVENLAPGLHEIAECLDKDEMVCSSSQDEENEPPCTNINDQLGSRLCASEDIEALEASGSMVKDKRSHEDSSLICLDDSQKSSSQTEAVSHDMDVKCCSVSENAEETKVCERHLSEWNADEVADVQCEALHVMDTAVRDDTKKDVIGHSPGRNTVELDNHRCGASQDMDLVMTCGANKDMGVCSLESNAIKLDDDTCEAPQEVDSVMVDDARNDNVKEAGTSVHELNGGKQSISAKLKEGNTDNGMIAAGYAERDEAPADGEGVDNANVVEEDAPCKTCSDGKRPRLDDTCSEKDVTSDGGSPLNKDDVRGSDAKTQLQYKRRKVANPDGEKRRTRSATRGSPLI